MNKLDTFLYKFLVEENKMDVNEFNLLTEDFKLDTIKQLASNVLAKINSKISTIDVLQIDKSRGEIKNFTDLSTIQDAIMKLLSMCESGVEEVNPLLPKYLKDIIETISNLNKFSSTFKDAYRNKKTFLILKYQSIILSIVAALSYMISVSIDFKDAEHLKLKKSIDINEITPIKSLMDFNNSVTTGMFDAAVKDTQTLREFFNEYSVEELSTIYEAVDIVSLLNNGINAFNNNFLGDKKRNGLLLKALGVVSIILSLRDIFFMLYNSKNKFNDAIQNIKTFLNVKNIPSYSALSRFITFNNKNVVDAEKATQYAKQQINFDDNNIIASAKATPSEFDSTMEYIPNKADPQQVDTKSSEQDIFSQFGF